MGRMDEWMNRSGEGSIDKAESLAGVRDGLSVLLFGTSLALVHQIEKVIGHSGRMKRAQTGNINETKVVADVLETSLTQLHEERTTFTMREIGDVQQIEDHVEGDLEADQLLTDISQLGHLEIKDAILDQVEGWSHGEIAGSSVNELQELLEFSTFQVSDQEMGLFLLGVLVDHREEGSGVGGEDGLVEDDGLFAVLADGLSISKGHAEIDTVKVIDDRVLWNSSDTNTLRSSSRRNESSSRRRGARGRGDGLLGFGDGKVLEEVKADDLETRLVEGKVGPVLVGVVGAELLETFDLELVSLSKHEEDVLGVDLDLELSEAEPFESWDRQLARDVHDQFGLGDGQLLKVQLC